MPAKTRPFHLRRDAERTFCFRNVARVRSRELSVDGVLATTCLRCLQNKITEAGGAGISAPISCDVRIIGEGSVALVEPVTSAGKRWVRENLSIEDWQWQGEAFACEPRMLLEIYRGVRDAGLAIDSVAS